MFLELKWGVIWIAGTGAHSLTVLILLTIHVCHQCMEAAVWLICFESSVFSVETKEDALWINYFREQT